MFNLNYYGEISMKLNCSNEELNYFLCNRQFQKEWVGIFRAISVKLDKCVEEFQQLGLIAYDRSNFDCIYNIRDSELILSAKAINIPTEFRVVLECDRGIFKIKLYTTSSSLEKKVCGLIEKYINTISSTTTSTYSAGYYNDTLTMSENDIDSVFNITEISSYELGGDVSVRDKFIESIDIHIAQFIDKLLDNE